MAKNVRNVFGWKLTSRENVDPRARLFGIIKNANDRTANQETLTANAWSTAAANHVRVEKEIAEARYFAAKGTLAP